MTIKVQGLSTLGKYKDCCANVAVQTDTGGTAGTQLRERPVGKLNQYSPEFWLIISKHNDVILLYMY